MDCRSARKLVALSLIAELRTVGGSLKIAHFGLIGLFKSLPFSLEAWLTSWLPELYSVTSTGPLKASPDSFRGPAAHHVHQPIIQRHTCTPHTDVDVCHTPCYIIILSHFVASPACTTVVSTRCTHLAGPALIDSPWGRVGEIKAITMMTTSVIKDL